MIKTIKRELNKDKYIKELHFRMDKSVKVKYYHENNYKPTYLVNNDHFFLSNGYRTVLISDTKQETINPLDLKSAYPVDKFQTAIESKVINDVFRDLKTEKMDLVKVLLIGNLLIGLVLIYTEFMGSV